jgi:hypothetical protein
VLCRRDRRSAAFALTATPQHVWVSSVTDAHLQRFPQEQLAQTLQAVNTSPELASLKDVRNVLTHRAAPGRAHGVTLADTVFVGGGGAGRPRFELDDGDQLAGPTTRFTDHGGPTKVARRRADGDHVCGDDVRERTSLEEVTAGGAPELESIETGGRVLAPSIQIAYARYGLVEVKASESNAWYGAIENLRQLKLLRESEATRRLFEFCRPELRLPPDLRISGLVVGPRGFFTGNGKKGNAPKPAQLLLDRLRADTGIDVRLAVWDSSAIQPLTTIAASG